MISFSLDLNLPPEGRVFVRQRTMKVLQIWPRLAKQTTIGHTKTTSDLHTT